LSKVKAVLKGPKPSIPIVIARSWHPDTEVEAKDAWVGERRYVICRNLAEARRDAAIREAVLRGCAAGKCRAPGRRGRHYR